MTISSYSIKGWTS